MECVTLSVELVEVSESSGKEEGEEGREGKNGSEGEFFYPYELERVIQFPQCSEEFILPQVFSPTLL